MHVMKQLLLAQALRYIQVVSTDTFSTIISVLIALLVAIRQLVYQIQDVLLVEVAMYHTMIYTIDVLHVHQIVTLVFIQQEKDVFQVNVLLNSIQYQLFYNVLVVQIIVRLVKLLGLLQKLFVLIMVAQQDFIEILDQITA